MEDTEIENIIKSAYKKSESTLKSYLHRIRHLLKLKGLEHKTYYEIIANPEDSYTIIRTAHANVNSRKNVLTVILALYKHSDKLKGILGAQHGQWRMYHDHMDSFQEAKYKKHAPDQKQLAKYTPFEDIETKYAELRKGDPHKTRRDSLEYIMLSIIVSTPPKRSDYGRMHVYYDNDPNNKDENYIVLFTEKNTPSYMVFNNYKTAKYTNRVDQVLSLKTAKDIKDSFRRHPRDYLFVNRFGAPFSTNGGYSKFVIGIFSNLFGRETGVTMLRHIYITEKLSFDDMDDEELEDQARQMLHTTTLQRKYKWTKKGICDALKKLCKDCK
jgi:hypothetical protein